MLITDSQVIMERRLKGYACCESIDCFMEVATTLVVKVATILMVMNVSVLHVILMNCLNATGHTQGAMGTRLADTGCNQAGSDQQKQDQIAQTLTPLIGHGR